MMPGKYKVIEAYKTPYPDSIKFEQGEEVRIVEKPNDEPDWPNWVWCEGKNNNKAWVPVQYLEVQGKTGVLNAVYDAKELNVDIGEAVTLFEILNGFAVVRNAAGEIGWIPSKCLAPCDK